MGKRGNIHSVINARGLARKLIDVDLNNEGVSLQIPNLVKMKFDKYLKEGLNSDTSEMSDEYIAKKALQFVHSTRAPSSKTAYRNQMLKGDASHKSFYDSCERIISKEKRIGDCVGLTQIVKFLLDSKGLDVNLVHYPGHVALEAEIDGEMVPLETTSPNGYGHTLKTRTKTEAKMNLISIVANNMGISLNSEETGLDEKAIESYNRAIIEDPKNNFAYCNRSSSLARLGRNDEAIADCTKAIKIDSNRPVPYFNRGMLYARLGKVGKALSDFEKYASFDKLKAQEAVPYISKLKTKLKLTK